MCEWYAQADDVAVYAETQQEAQLWLAAHIRNGETQEERDALEAAKAAYAASWYKKCWATQHLHRQCVAHHISIKKYTVLKIVPPH